MGPGAISLSEKGKAMEIAIIRLLRSDEISGEIQAIKGRSNQWGIGDVRIGGYLPVLG